MTLSYDHMSRSGLLSWLISKFYLKYWETCFPQSISHLYKFAVQEYKNIIIRIVNCCSCGKQICLLKFRAYDVTFLLPPFLHTSLIYRWVMLWYRFLHVIFPKSRNLLWSMLWVYFKIATPISVRNMRMFFTTLHQEDLFRFL
jgi:hypothetical protein